MCVYSQNKKTLSRFSVFILSIAADIYLQTLYKYIYSYTQKDPELIYN